MKGIAKQKVPVWYGEKHKKTTWSNFSLLLLIMIFLLLKTVCKHQRSIGRNICVEMIVSKTS